MLRSRAATPMAHTHPGLAKPWLCSSRTRRETYGAHSLWLSRRLGSEFPERDARHMMHIHSGLAQPRFGLPRTRGEPYVSRRFWVGETEALRSQNENRAPRRTLLLGWRTFVFAVPKRDASHTAHTQCRLAKSKFCIPRTRCEPYRAHSFWVGRT